MAPRADANGTGTLGKAMDVLDAVAAAPSPPRFTDLLQCVDQPRGTLHRQISNLVEEGLLSVRKDHSYELGIRLLRLASQAWSGNQFRMIAEPHLRRLHDATGETVHLGVLSGSEVVYLDKVEGRQAVRMHSQIGNASPVYCTGVGKAALSAFPEEELERRLSVLRFRNYTTTTLAGVEALRRGARTDVGGPDRSVDRAAAGRARLRAGGAVAEVGAQEHHDAAVDVLLLEVEMGLADVALHVEVPELPIQLCSILVDGG